MAFPKRPRHRFFLMGPNRALENEERRRGERIVHYYRVPPPAPPLDQLLLDVGVAIRDSSLEHLRIAFNGHCGRKRKFNKGQKRYLDDLADVLVEENQPDMFDYLLSHHMGHFDWWRFISYSECLADWLPILLKHGVNLNEINPYKLRPNWWDCIGLGDTTALKLVLESGKVDVNQAYIRGKIGALDHAAKRCCLNSFRLLVEAGADPHRSCALHLAAGRESDYDDEDDDDDERRLVEEDQTIAFMEYLLNEMFMDVNRKVGHDGRLIPRAAAVTEKTALGRALGMRTPRRALLLLQRGANPALGFGSFSNALQYAEVLEDDDEVLMVLQAWLTTRRSIE